MVVNGPGFPNGTIILDEPEAVYYAGQLMSGNVHFELNELLSISAINIVYLGEAKVQWSEGQNEMSGGNRRYVEVKYLGLEKYFQQVQCVFGGTGTSSLPAGVHSIPFKFQVPFNVPSSTEGEEGNIRYSVSAYLEHPEPGRRDELSKEFQVIAPLYVNARQPLQLDFEEIETCNCFCQSKPISVKVQLPSTAFHVGSIIPITVQADNDSSIEIYEMSFKIVMKRTYRTQTPRSEYSAPEEDLVEIRKGPVLSNTRREYHWELALPDQVLPNLQHCSIMDAAFFFKVKIRMTGCNDDVEDESEISIGVLPPTERSGDMSPTLAQRLPKAPIPVPPPFTNNLTAPAPITPNRSPIMQSKYPDSANAPTQPFNPPMGLNQINPPYGIGFQVPHTQTYPNPYAPKAYPSNTGYPHPAMPLVPMRNPSYTMVQTTYNFNSSPNNIAAPSAPPP